MSFESESTRSSTRDASLPGDVPMTTFSTTIDTMEFRPSLANYNDGIPPTLDEVMKQHAAKTPVRFTGRNARREGIKRIDGLGKTQARWFIPIYATSLLASIALFIYALASKMKRQPNTAVSQMTGTVIIWGGLFGTLYSYLANRKKLEKLTDKIFEADFVNTWKCFKPIKLQKRATAWIVGSAGCGTLLYATLFNANKINRLFPGLGSTRIGYILSAVFLCFHYLSMYIYIQTTNKFIIKQGGAMIPCL